MGSITLTTSYNTTKVVYNGKTIKQVWLKEGSKDKVQVYQAWKTESYQQPHYFSQQGLRGSGCLVATSQKVFLSGHENSGKSYVIYSFRANFDIDGSIVSNGSYIKFYYYDPSGTLKASATGWYGDDTELFDTTFTYTAVYGNDSNYDKKGYTGKMLIIPSVAVVTSDSAKTVDGTTVTATVTSPNVTSDSSTSSSASTGWQYANAYAGITTYTDETRNVEDND